MIDNVLNNMPPKKESYLEYFAAECDEFCKIWKDEEIHVYVMVEICDVPNCDIEDIVEVIPDEEEQANDER